MTQPDVRETVLRCLRDVAPDADLGVLRPSDDLRESLDLDSIDFLRFVQAIDRSLGVAIPEAEYRVIATLEGCVEHVSRRLSRGGT